MARVSRCLSIGCGIGLALALTVAAVAQSAEERERGRDRGRRAGPPGGMMMGRSMGGDAIGLLRSEAIQKELELVDAQKEKLRALAEELRSQMGRSGERGERQELTEEQRRARMAEFMEKAKARAEETRTKLAEILLPAQLERLEQIQLQLRGSMALADSKVAEALKLTEEQKVKLRQIGEKLSEQRRSLFGDRPGADEQARRARWQEISEKMRKLSEQAREESLQVLTAEQREALEKMKGKAFDVEALRAGFGGPGGRSRPAEKKPE